jgi:hypothetical protein
MMPTYQGRLLDFPHVSCALVYFVPNVAHSLHVFNTSNNWTRILDAGISTLPNSQPADLGAVGMGIELTRTVVMVHTYTMDTASTTIS